MQQLRFVGVHDDGEHLVLEAPESGERFRVVIDSSLRNAVLKARRAHPARGLSGNGVFGPRDIQTRFRQGATIDEIVAESGWKPERVKRYEWPILAERAHIVTAARAVLVDPLSGEEGLERLSLNDQVVAVRERWNFAEGDAQWNSWQREDGQWNVSVSVDYSRAALDQIPEGSDFPARFVYNPANQTVVAGNAVAEFLLGRPLERERPEQAAEDRAALQAVPEDEPDTEAELLDELEERRGTRVGEDPHSDARVEDLTDRLAQEGAAQEETEQETPQEGTDGAEEPESRGRGKRPSVPSWDDILFGNRH
ncbi:septation protein SepH [Rothia halotolerans]|uniref:septation protein SepH n=1 Tax=Rothia halotolerans TaxID=405770 RepID=UPI00101D10AF|nr:septation protein SepH [Rothia halotolerans]